MTTVPLGDLQADAVADALRDPDRCAPTLTALAVEPAPGWAWEGPRWPSSRRWRWAAR